MPRTDAKRSDSYVRTVILQRDRAGVVPVLVVDLVALEVKERLLDVAVVRYRHQRLLTRPRTVASDDADDAEEVHVGEGALDGDVFALLDGDVLLVPLGDGERSWRTRAHSLTWLNRIGNPAAYIYWAY